MTRATSANCGAAGVTPRAAGATWRTLGANVRFSPGQVSNQGHLRSPVKVSSRGLQSRSPVQASAGQSSVSRSPVQCVHVANPGQSRSPVQASLGQCRPVQCVQVSSPVCACVQSSPGLQSRSPVQASLVCPGLQSSVCMCLVQASPDLQSRSPVQASPVC